MGVSETEEIPNRKYANNWLSKNMDWEGVVEHTAQQVGKSKDSKFKKWFRSKEGLGGRMFDPLTVVRCYKIYQDLMFKEKDHISIFQGTVGSGKSWFAMQICSMVSPTFGLKYVCWDMEQFVNALRDSSPGDSIQCDEGIMFFYGRDAMSRENKQLGKLLTIMRTKHLHLAVCVPNFYRLDTMLREDREETMTVFDLYGNRSFRAFNKDAIHKINEMRYKKLKLSNITIPNGSFWDGYNNSIFPEVNDLNLTTYKMTKQQNTDSFIDDLQTVAKMSGAKKEYHKPKELAVKLGVSDQTIRSKIKQGKIEAKQMGKHFIIPSSEFSRVVENGLS